METKTCRACGGVKPSSDFYRRAAACKPCTIARVMARQKADPARQAQYQRAYAAAHADDLRRNRRAWEARHPDKMAAARRNWRLAHPAETNANTLRRIARIRGATISDLTLAQWEAIKAAHDHRCAYCGARVKLTQDHVIPLSKGGQHTASNIVPACQPCNSRKGNRLITT